MTTGQDHAQGGRAREPGLGTVVPTDGDHDDHGAGDQAARRAAKALTRIAREATRIAQDGQALAEEAARAASQRQMAADVVGAIAERAQQLAEARQQLAEDAHHLAEDAQHLAEKNQHVAEKNQHVAEKNQHVAEEAQYLAEDAQHLAEKNQHVAEEAQRTTLESLRLRTETLAVVAHDLRTPLTSLVGRADQAQMRLARGVDLNPDRAWLAAQLAAVQAAATRLRGAIDELDDVVHLVAGRELALMRELVDVGLLVRAVAQGFALQHTVVVEAPDTPVFVSGDRARLDRVLQNLIGNAVKYSPAEAAVDVEVTVARGDAAAVAVIAVRDGGIGIPAAEVPRIFERYYRASTARDIAGSGLGLAGRRPSSRGTAGPSRWRARRARARRSPSPCLSPRPWTRRRAPQTRAQTRVIPLATSSVAPKRRQARRPRGDHGSSRGNHTVTVVPSPTPEATSIRPPWAAMSS